MSYEAFKKIGVGVDSFFIISMPQSCEVTTRGYKNDCNYFLQICSWT